MAALLVVLLAACTPAGTGGLTRTPSPHTPPAGAQVSGPPLDLRVMTYNVLGGPVPDDWFPLIARQELVPSVRAPGTVAKLRLADPDVAALQEFATGSEPAGWIERHLPAYIWLHGPDNHALLVRAARFEVLATGDRRLNSTGEEGSFLDRYVDWARLRERSSGRTVLVLNVHAHPLQTPELAAVRSLAVHRLVDLVAELDPALAEPLVLLGDFNASDSETRPVFRDHLVLLRRAGLVDARTVAARDTSDVPRANSLHQLSGKVAGRYVAKVVRRSGRQIDYVWVPEGARVRTWQVLSGPGVAWRRVRGVRVPTWTGVVPSDHSPVVAELRFP